MAPYPGMEMSRVAKATVRVTPSRMLWATRSGSYFNFFIALRTRRRTSSLTDLCPLRTRETVPTATLAATATSRIVGPLPIYALCVPGHYEPDAKALDVCSLRRLRNHNNLSEKVP